MSRHSDRGLVYGRGVERAHRRGRVVDAVVPAGGKVGVSPRDREVYSPRRGPDLST